MKEQSGKTKPISRNGSLDSIECRQDSLKETHQSTKIQSEKEALASYVVDMTRQLARVSINAGLVDAAKLLLEASQEAEREIATHS